MSKHSKDDESIHNDERDPDLSSVDVPPRPPANGFVKVMRKVYNPIGFKKGYNFILFFIFAIGLFAFSLARLEYLSIGGKFKEGSAPGEWYWMQKGFRRVGITLHLATILPAGLLLPLQFIPLIRYRVLLFHRLNGYLILTLLLISNAAALMITRHAFGGEFETQVYVGLLVIITTVSASLAYYNIKKLQIEQHRAWMIRTWMYAGTIVTLRIIMIISALIIGKTEQIYQVRSCAELSSIYALNSKPPSDLESDFPLCSPSTLNSTTTNGNIAVPAKFSGSGANIGAALGITFGTSGWLALFLHALGTEIYLALTTRETERLRRVSWQRQMERGWKRPGEMGLVRERWGDCVEWKAPRK